MGIDDKVNSLNILDQTYIIRKGSPENASDFSRLILISAPTFFPVLLGPYLHNLMETLYHKSGNLFSHEHVWFLKVQEKTAGMVLGYTGDEKNCEGLTTGLLFLKHFMEHGLLRKIVYLLRVHSIVDKVKKGDFYISNIAIYPEYQGKGFGTHLLRMIESEALKKGCTGIKLDVEAVNQKAYLLYQKLGYEVEWKSPSLVLGKNVFQFLRMQKLLFI